MTIFMSVFHRLYRFVFPQYLFAIKVFIFKSAFLLDISTYTEAKTAFIREHQRFWCLCRKQNKFNRCGENVKEKKKNVIYFSPFKYLMLVDK